MSDAFDLQKSLSQFKNRLTSYEDFFSFMVFKFAFKAFTF